MGGPAHDAAVGAGGDDAAARRDAIQRDVDEQRTRPADEGAPHDGQEWAADYSREAREAAISIESSGVWRWPMYRVLQENYECDTLRQAELAECITGYASLRDNEKWELTYWFGVTCRLNDSLMAHEADVSTEGGGAGGLSGGDRLPPRQHKLIHACYRQAEERVTYLTQVAACSEPDSDHTRAYWQTLARHELEDRRAAPVRGSLGRAHATTQLALRTARAKATAQSELARLRVAGKKNG